MAFWGVVLYSIVLVFGVLSFLLVPFGGLFIGVDRYDRCGCRQRLQLVYMEPLGTYSLFSTECLALPVE